MYADMMSAFSGSMQNFAGPIQKINQMAIAHMEKVVVIQMESVKTYTYLGIGQWKAAGEVSDPWSLARYLAKQGAYATEIAEQIIADARKLGELGGDFVQQAQSVAQEEARAIQGALGDTGKRSAKMVA
jgi:phasin family protein